MDPYGPVWIRMDPYGPNGSIRVHTDPYGAVAEKSENREVNGKKFGKIRWSRWDAAQALLKIRDLALRRLSSVYKSSILF